MRTQNIYNLADTWNNGSATFDAIKMNVTDTTSASGSRLLNLLVGGTSKFRVKKDGEVGIISLGFASSDANSPDTFFKRAAANSLAIENGTNNQSLLIYNTTDGTNYERFYFRASGTRFKIGTEKGGTGSARAFTFEVDGTSRWEVDTSGHFVPFANDTYNIGSTGVRVKNAYFSGFVNLNQLILPVASTLTLASDAITVTGSSHAVDTEGAAASDNLFTINGGSDGIILLLRPANGARDIVVKHAGGGNIRLDGAADYTMDSTIDYIMLVYQSANSVWCEIGRGNNGS